jgi:hypothetical protein
MKIATGGYDGITWVDPCVTAGLESTLTRAVHETQPMMEQDLAAFFF